ncbi:MAG: NUDIX hydrolase [Bacteroidetes bacterium]|nr:MAG: NUDIX hydrolase [Bacteroidota bacterium]
MEQMYKVFYNDKAIFLKDKCLELIPDSTVQVVQDKEDLFAFLRFFFARNQIKNICVTGYSQKEMFRDFTSYFILIEAAGGLVSNVENKFLFIKRFDKWDLPKGKVEKGEHPREAAVREVEEETGVTGLVVVEELPPTYHIYPYEDNLILKKTFWYRMTTESNSKLKPQLKEDITEVVWQDLAQSKKALAESYRSLYETLSPFLEEKS